MQCLLCQLGPGLFLICWFIQFFFIQSSFSPLLWSMMSMIPLFLCPTKKHPLYFTFPVIVMFLITSIFLLLNPWECKPIVPSKEFFILSCTLAFFPYHLFIQINSWVTSVFSVWWMLTFLVIILPPDLASKELLGQYTYDVLSFFKFCQSINRRILDMCCCKFWVLVAKHRQ